jgi:hypothetical protein
VIARSIAVILLAAAAGPAAAQALQLISEDEAKLPAATGAIATRGVTRGPGVKLASPESVAKGNFAFKVAFEPRGGSKIDPASVKVIYLKNPPVDLTDRLKPAIKPDGIEVASATAPAGEHPLRVTVRDDEGRQGTAQITLTVK